MLEKNGRDMEKADYRAIRDILEEQRDDLAQSKTIGMDTYTL